MDPEQPRKQSSTSPFSSTTSLDKQLDKLAHPAITSFSTSPAQHPGLPQRSPSSSSLHKSSIHSHRSSFAENLRNHHTPSSPRTSRHPSFTQSAVQELMAHPPPSRQPNPLFAGRDWRDVRLGELVALNSDELRWVDMDSSVEEATMMLVKGSAAGNCVMIKDGPLKQPVSFFDYNDLNAYLVAVVGLAKPDEEHVQLYDSIAKRAQEREAIPMRDIQPICRHEQLVSLPPDEFLPGAIEVFGSGVHRILVTTQEGETIGVVSQLKLLEFFWNEGVNFPIIDRLYPALLKELQIGSQQIIAINADAPLAEALVLMSNEGLTSIAVIDNASNVVGNISTADTRLLTSAASMPLLEQTCMHFVTVILTERGMEKGRDSVPVFYVTPYSTLAGTVAKLVATRSHRMWVVESASPSPSAPATPLLGPVGAPTNTISGGGNAGAVASTTAGTVGSISPSVGTTVITPSSGGTQVSAPPSPLPLSTPLFTTSASVPAAALPGAHLSGRLTAVVSLTDILNLFARSSGLNPRDPGDQRERRRRSSSSSVRPSLDGDRASVRGSLDFRR
ncbi:cell separation during budding [Gnomoniopsis smithogilvyi]|uniref:Protein SDS23 n=1 Tax=Gnomoniopsis smithogilvyi TaxID=1191159 RepID=A0A9W8YMS0_9PEZI|nr:cell separation during budding [Gnomoniopsis smithogilvyi]